MADKIITVPDIGGAEGAEVVEVLVAPGDSITLEQSLIVLESDKASMEIPATVEGTVVELRVAVGDQLSEGDAILTVATLIDDADSAMSVDKGQNAPIAVESSVEEVAPTAAESAAAPAPASNAPLVVVIPDIGTDGDVDLIEVSVEVGQAVAEGDTLVVLESDKASMEVPAPASGTVKALLVSAGASVRQGAPIVELSVAVSESTVSEDAAAPEAATASPPVGDSSSAASPSPLATAKAESMPPASEAPTGSVYAGPAVRKLAREFGIDLVRVTGSGPRGRILKSDLHQFVKSNLSAPEPIAGGASGSAIPPIPEVDFSKFGPIDPQPRSRLDKVTAANMSRSWLNVPHVTQFDDADITDLEAFRKSLKAEAERRGTKITPMPFIIKACAVALNAHPKMKASLADGGDTLVYKQYCHIGMAVDTPAGLVVPVIRDVDLKSIWQISEEVLTLAGQAKDKKLRPDQMQGGVFTVSSLGGIGGKGFTPIVNAPEVAILGVSRADVRPVWNGKDFEPRTLLPVSLSYDHRVVNGGDAGRFLTHLCALLADIRRMML